MLHLIVLTILLVIILLLSYIVYLQYKYLVKAKYRIENYILVLSAHTDSIAHLVNDIKKTDKLIRLLRRRVQVRDRIIVAKNAQIKILTEGKSNVN